MNNSEKTTTGDKPIWYVDTSEVEFRYDRDTDEHLSNHSEIYLNEWDRFRGGGTQYILHIGDKRIGFQDHEQGRKGLNHLRSDGVPVVVFDVICCPVIASKDAITQKFGDRYANIGVEGDSERTIYTNVHKFSSIEEQNYILSLFAKAINVSGRL